MKPGSGKESQAGETIRSLSDHKQVVREALRLIERQERECDEAFRELKAKLKRGADQADRGELLDGNEVFEELREMIEERRQGKARKQ